jgi:acetylornithine/succinyldiaminopimelate/putrescine aminotransferase
MTTHAVLAMQEHVASKYAVGLYGNTMTTNPRGLDVATEVLRAITPEVRRNIIERGVEFQHKFGELVKKHPSILTRVTGSGLLQAVHLHPSVPMFGGNQKPTTSFLAACRHAGIGVIK